MINNRQFAIILVCFILFWGDIGCKQKSRTSEIPGYTLRRIVLQDSVADVNIYLPNELDTFLEWTDVSDNACDDYRKYRFADKKYAPVAETGFFKTEHADSVYQFTISHINRYGCKYYEQSANRINDSIELCKTIERKKEYHQIFGDSFLLISAQTITYDNYLFEIMAYSLSGERPKKHHSVLLSARTVIDSSYLEFEYQTDGSKTGDFINRMQQSLATVKIKYTNSKK